ncbi:hypothetical protein C6A85_000000116020 [Mycobacterium sp. ITM-2017-0098]|nr:hypothetical protein C6A85_000000116020 [Mycobacterium sp. ITM-2017-0098]
MLIASMVALVLPWVTISGAEAKPPKLDLSAFERCMGQPAQTNAHGSIESSYQKRKRCCDTAGGTLVFSPHGPPNCVQGSAESPRAVVDMPSLGVLTPSLIQTDVSAGQRR